MPTESDIVLGDRRFGAGLDPAFGRRVSDKVMLAFHQACDQDDLDLARRLMGVLEFMWLRDLDDPWGRRRNVNYLVPSRDRLRHLIYVAQQRELAAAAAAGGDGDVLSLRWRTGPRGQT